MHENVLKALPMVPLPNECSDKVVALREKSLTMVG